LYVKLKYATSETINLKKIMVIYINTLTILKKVKSIF